MPLDRGQFDDVLGPFTDAMRYKLQNSKRFGGSRSWEGTEPERLLDYLRAEVAELEEALREGSALEAVLEAVDVANVAMMISDRLGLRHVRRGERGAPVDDGEVG